MLFAYRLAFNYVVIMEWNSSLAFNYVVIIIIIIYNSVVEEERF